LAQSWHEMIEAENAVISTRWMQSLS